MVALIDEATCRILIADRGHFRYGMSSALQRAGFLAVEIANPQRALRELGLLEMDALLEIELSAELADFFPEAFHLSTWRTLVCGHGPRHQPTLVLVRKEGQDPAIAQSSYQEIVTMLQTIARKHSPAVADTLPDTPLPVGLGPCAGQVARLSSAVAHDLNNLLAVIRGNCLLLRDTQVLADTARKLVEEIHQAQEQAVLLTGQLDSLGHLDPSPAEVRDLNQLVRQSAGMLQSFLGAGNRLILHLTDAPTPLRMFPGQFERILLNLAANARDALAGHGTLTIATTLLPAHAARPERCPAGPVVQLSISDNGPGLDPRIKEHLFRSRQSTKPSGKGLGLAIVHNLVQRAGGHIDVHSERGQGTHFRIFLPLVTASHGVPVVDRTAQVPEVTPTVLLVEDENMVRSIFRRILQESGFFILEAADGAEALVLAQQFPWPIHLLVSDVSMPRMSGPELAEKLQALHPEARILLLSGAPDTALASRGLKGQFAFLQKPFNADMLLAKARQLLGAN